MITALTIFGAIIFALFVVVLLRGVWNATSYEATHPTSEYRGQRNDHYRDWL